MADTGQWGGGMDIGGGGWGEDYTRWLELKEREQLHFIMWAQDHNKGNMSALDAAIRGDDPDNNPLAQIEKKQDEIDKEVKRIKALDGAELRSELEESSNESCNKSRCIITSFS